MNRCLLFLFIFQAFTLKSSAQQEVVVLSAGLFQSHQRIFLAPLDGWIFKQGHDPNWANPDIDLSGWQTMNPTALNPEMEDEDGRIEGWFRINIRLNESLQNIPFYLSRSLWAATDIYLDGKLLHSFGDAGNPYAAFNPILKYPVPVDMVVGKEYLLAIHFVDYESTFTQREIRLTPHNLKPFLNLTGPDYVTWVTRDHKLTHIYVTLSLGVSFLLFFLYWFLVYLNPDQIIFRIIAWFTTVVLVGTVFIFGNTFIEISYSWEKIRFLLAVSFQAIMIIFSLFMLEWVLTRKISKMSWVILVAMLITNIVAHVFSISPPFGITFIVMLLYFGRKFYAHRGEIKGAIWAIVSAVVVATGATMVYITLHKYSLDLFHEYEKPLLSLTILSLPLFLLAYISVRFKETLMAMQTESKKLLRVTEEKREILANQNLLLESQIKERTRELSASLENLKSTQSQLIQSEKMASLGELTAGIAHEIQNPLNFVNNFSEVNLELLEEVRAEIILVKTQDIASQRDVTKSLESVKDIIDNIKENEEKIVHHGKRADSIVKGMLQHSRSSSGVKEPTDINALTDEYLRLAYHGLRAKDKSFNATMKTDYDPSSGKINIVPQEIGRVILNLITNAFYAVSTSTPRPSKEGETYVPTVTITTRRLLPSGAGQKVDQSVDVEISVRDNGSGIPEHLKDKIFQPFFTTKPTGQGTGLGLSLSYDIVKAHGGELKVESIPGEGSTFRILLPVE